MDIDNSQVLGEEKQKDVEVGEREEEAVEEEVEQVVDCHLQGEVVEFISNGEMLWRTSTKYQDPPFKLVAEYLRNIEYKPSTVRSPDTLKRCTTYLIQTLLPLLHNNQYRIQETIQFISNRMKAIRSQYYVQSKTDIETLEAMMRYQCVASAYTYSLSEIIVVVKTLFERYKKTPELAKPEFLKYIFIVSSNSKDFDQIILIFDTLFPAFDWVREYTQLAASLRQSQFSYYFEYLRDCTFFQSCILVPYLKNMRYNAIRAFAISQLILDLDYLSDYLFMTVNGTLELLQLIGYDVKEMREKTLRNESVKVPLKMKLKDMKQPVDKSKQIPTQILQKLQGMSESEAILQ